MNWLTGENVSLGGVLFPHFHFNAVYGRTDIEEGHEFAAGHHDPITDGWTIQGIEMGLSGRWHENFETFGAVHFFEDAETGDWDHEFEEWFGKLKNLPFGLELRGGRYLNRFGLHNATHLHGWDFVDNHLVNGRFLGDDGLYTIGGELSWQLPVDSMRWTSVLSLSAGEAQREEHEHHEHHEEEEGEEALFSAEGAYWDATVYVGNWTNVYRVNDFHQWRFGLSGAFGDNLWGRTTSVYGAHLEYQWRENGLERGGRYVRWRTEAMFRNVDALTGHLPGEEEHHDEEEGEETAEEEEEGRSGSFEEFGVYSSVVAGVPTSFAGPLEFGLRADFVEGVADAGLPRRFRLSPSVRLYCNDVRTAYLGFQYNYDDIQDVGSEHSFWLSVGINWGGAEVR